MLGLCKDLSMLEVRSIFAEVELDRFVRGKVYWEGDHIPANHPGLYRHLYLSSGIPGIYVFIPVL